MNEKIKQHLVAYATKNNWPTDDDTLVEILTEADELYKKKVRDSRWWYTEFIVVDIDGMLIGYEYASANRDEHVRDLGWEFDPNTICEVKAVEKTVIVYEKVNSAVKDSVTNNMNITNDPSAAIQQAPDELKKEDAPAEQATEVKATETEANQEGAAADAPTLDELAG